MFYMFRIYDIYFIVYYIFIMLTELCLGLLGKTLATFNILTCWESLLTPAGSRYTSNRIPIRCQCKKLLRTQTNFLRRVFKKVLTNSHSDWPDSHQAQFDWRRARSRKHQFENRPESEAVGLVQKCLM